MRKINLLQCDDIPRRRDDVPRIEFREVDALRRLSRECGRGPVAVAVTGPAGAGKTVFLGQAERALAALGFDTVMTRAVAEHLVCDPRLSLRDWWQRAASAGLGQSEQGASAGLDTLLPAGIETLPPALRRECVAEFLWAGLRRATEQRPVALLVDDGPALGEVAVRALERTIFAASQAHAPLVCVVVTDVAWAQRWQQQDSLAAHIALRGLRAADLEGCEPIARGGKPLADRIIERTGGLPQYVFNVLATFRETGGQRRGDLHGLCAEAPADLVRERIGLLSDNGRETLAAIACCGRSVPVAFVRRVLGRDSTAFDAQLGALLQAGFIARGGQARVIVGDRLVARAAREALYPEHAAMLHRQIAETLASEGGLAVEICRHRELAGIEDRDHGDIAVRELRMLGQIEEAAAFASGGVCSPETLRALADDLARDGRQEPEEGRRDAAGPPQAAGAAGEIAAALAFAHAGKYDAAYHALRVRAGDETPYAAWLRAACAGRIAALLGHADEAGTLRAEAARLGAASGFAALRGRTRLLDGEELMLAEDGAGARRALTEAQVALGGGSPQLAARAALGLASLAMDEGEYHQALAHTHRATTDLGVPLAEPWPIAEGPAPRSREAHEIADCRVLLDGGHADAAERAFMELRSSTCADAEATGRRLLALADLVLAYGNDAVALACVTEALKRARGSAGVELIARANLVTAKVCVLVGNYTRAFASAARAFRGAVLAYDREALAEVCILYARLLRVVGAIDLSARFCAMSLVVSAAAGTGRLSAGIACENAWILLAQDRRREAVEAASRASSGDIRTVLERKLVAAAAHGGDEGAALAQEVADAAKAAGIQDLIAEAALIVGRVRSHGGERGLLQAIELMQGVVDLAERRRRPELVVRAKIALGELFLLRRRERPAHEFLRGAGEELSRLHAHVPRLFRAHFLAKPDYRRAVEALGGAAAMGEECANSVENLLKTDG